MWCQLHLYIEHETTRLIFERLTLIVLADIDITHDVQVQKRIREV